LSQVGERITVVELELLLVFGDKLGWAAGEHAIDHMDDGDRLCVLRLDCGTCPSPPG
jgi:hypothetical protein